MIFIDTSIFTKVLPNYLSDDDYRGLQSYLLQKPDAGDIVRGSGGVRKVRWAPSGKGKVVVYVQYITGKSQNMRFGCLLCIVNLSVQQLHLIFLSK